MSEGRALRDQKLQQLVCQPPSQILPMCLHLASQEAPKLVTATTSMFRLSHPRPWLSKLAHLCPTMISPVSICPDVVVP